MALFNPFRTASPKDNDVPVFSYGTKIWYDSGAADVDVVFVHGLTGDRDRTWTHQSASEPWPKTLLPPYLSNSRILAYGYNAYITKGGTAASNQLVDHSKDFLNSLTSLRETTETLARPLILVGHSLGGLVCKDALLQSRNNPESHLRDMFQSTVAIAFLGTPHGGSDLASWASIPAKALGVLKSTNTNLLSVLQTSSEVLYRIQNDFLSMIRDLREQERQLKITCFWESLPMPLVGTIVARSSASLAGYNAISINANHRDIAKFGMAEDPGFISVLGELKRWVKQVGYRSPAVLTAGINAEELQQQKLECLKSLTFPEIGSRKFNIDNPNPKTCEWIFNDSRYKIWDTATSGLGSSNLLWIKGKPGSGKSTLMKRVTQNHEEQSSSKNTFCCDFFFNARGTKLENSSLGLYRTLLFQLLRSSESLLADFLPRFLHKEKQCLGQRVTWQTPEISEYFHSVISEKQSRPVYIFIDALDECEEDEVRRIIRVFEDSSVTAVSNGAVVRICVSSRHYPHISLRTITGREIFMESHNGSDIRQYVRQELKICEEHLCDDLIGGLVKKSAGIFFWTRFMVQRLLKASDQGYSPEQMRAILENVPPSLEGLFEETLMSMDSDRLASMTILAPWVICAMRPLTLYELYAASAFNAKSPPLSLLDPKIHDAFDVERLRKHLIDVSGGLFETISINEELFVQVIHESVREFFLRSDKASRLMEAPPENGFLRYGHERIVKASCHYFHIEEIRLPLPEPDVHGYVPVDDLARMLHKPMKVPFETFTRYGISYFHDFVFVHVKELMHSSVTDIKNCEKSSTKCPRIILEGWLVFLYYSIIQSGALSSLQSRTLNLLRQNPWLLCLSNQELSRITNCIDNLVIFVNKAMKDGFTLKEAPYSRHGQDLRDDSTYIRMFWNGTWKHPFKEGVDFFRQHDYWNGPWVEYTKPRTIDDIVNLCNTSGIRFGLGFILSAVRSEGLMSLECCWSRGRFPSCDRPLRDWQIVEDVFDVVVKSRNSGPWKLETDIEDWEQRSLRSFLAYSRQEPLRSPLQYSHQDRTLGWNSILLKEHDYSDDRRREYYILAVRRDWEVEHYSLCRNTTGVEQEKPEET